MLLNIFLKDVYSGPTRFVKKARKNIVRGIQDVEKRPLCGIRAEKQVFYIFTSLKKKIKKYCRIGFKIEVQKSHHYTEYATNLYITDIMTKVNKQNL
jgi:alpha-amylase/alpha-mannosidase (GH57 family)